MKRLVIALNLLAGLLAGLPAYAQVAKVLRIDGAAMVDRVGQQRRFLGVGEQLSEGAVVTVAKESFVMLEFRDESRVTLRPNTVFRVEAYADQAPEKISFGLAKGGLRAVSGLVGKRKPEVVQINTSTAYIGIRGTEFDARMCEQDCEAEDRAAPPPTVSRAVVAARVVEIEGIAVATGATLPTRILTPGATLYERDSIATAPGAYVALAFPDGSIAALGADTVFGVSQYRFDRAHPERGAAALRLLEGSVRVMPGAIAQRKADAYRIETLIGPVVPAGGVVDLFCSAACVDPKTNARAEMLRMKEQADRAIAQVNAEAGVRLVADTTPKLALPKLPEDGLVVHAATGAAAVGGGDARSEVAKGATAIFATPGAAPRMATQTLAYIAQNPVMRPDEITVDPTLFDHEKTQTYEPGLYVWVREGAIVIDPLDAGGEAAAEPIRLAAAGSTQDLLMQRRLIVRAGQAARIAARRAFLLTHVPNFMRLDATPLPTRANVPSPLPFFQARDGSTVGLCTPP